MKYRICTQLSQYDEAAVTRCLAWFPKERVDNILKMKTVQGRAEKVAAYMLLVEMLQDEGLFHELPVLVYGEHGKPSLANYPDLHFNMSHCKEAVAVALHDAPVGIDVECRRKIDEPLIQKVCCPSEIDEIHASDDPAAEFIRIWTRKEAVAKYLGTGIGDDLPNILLAHSQLTILTGSIPNADGFVSVCY